MSRFTLNPTPEARCAPGMIRNLEATLDGVGAGRCVLMIVDPGLEAAGTRETVEAAAGATRSVRAVLPPPGEPKEAFVRDTVALAREQGAEAIVCVGGGSVIDAGKIVACLLDADIEADVSSFRLAAAPLPPRATPLIAAPTTAGTGAEATTTAILTSEEGVKHWFWSPSLKPDRVLLDPELTVGLPPHVTAVTGFDALVHALEAATNRNAFAANNIYAHRALRMAAMRLARAVAEPTDIEARSDMLEAAYFAGLAIDNAGTGVAHAIGHALGSLLGVGHGRAVAIGLCASLDWSIEGREADYAAAADAMDVVEARKLPAAVRGLAETIGIDLSLGSQKAALTVEELARQIAQPENQAMLQASRRPIEARDIALFAERVLALGGGQGDGA